MVKASPRVHRRLLDALVVLSYFGNAVIREFNLYVWLTDLILGSILFITSYGAT